MNEQDMPGEWGEESPEAGDAEAQLYRHMREQVKSEFCKLAEQLGEDALSGKVVALAAVLMDAQGNLTAVHLGVRLTEAVGMLELGLVGMKQGALRGLK